MAPEMVINWPLRGRCLVLNPPGHPRWAFDIVPVDPNTGQITQRSFWQYLAGGLTAKDVIGWDAPILAPVDGEVTVAQDGEPDHGRMIPWLDLPAAFLIRPFRFRKNIPAIAGNYVVIRSMGRFVLLAHLRHGSLQVRERDTVHTGDMIGRIGMSGNAVGPHLHIQVMNAPDPRTASVVPFAVRRFQQREGSTWRARSCVGLPSRRVQIRTE